MGQAAIGLALAVSLAATATAVEIPRSAPESVGMSSARLEAVAAKMDALVAAGEFPGMTAMIARRGQVVFQHSTGLLDVETGAPLRDDSLLRVYSMTKPITSVAAMMLVEDGELLLDAPVTRFFPEWRDLSVLVDGDNVPVAGAVTARHLLMHTSGLTYGYNGDTPVDRMYRKARLIDDWDYLTHDTRELVAKLADIPLLFQPGSRWHYGFSSDVLGHLVERVSGKPLDVFFRERLFEPLGMHDSFFDVPPDVVDRFGTDHYVNDGEVVVQDSPREDPEFIGVTFLSGGGGPGHDRRGLPAFRTHDAGRWTPAGSTHPEPDHGGLDDHRPAARGHVRRGRRLRSRLRHRAARARAVMPGVPARTTGAVPRGRSSGWIPPRNWSPSSCRSASARPAGFSRRCRTWSTPRSSRTEAAQWSAAANPQSSRSSWRRP